MSVIKSWDVNYTTWNLDKTPYSTIMMKRNKYGLPLNRVWWANRDSKELVLGDFLLKLI